MCLLAPSPCTVGPSEARSPTTSIPGSPRPRTQGRRPQPRYRRLLAAFAVLPSRSFDHLLLALSFRREGARFRINYRGVLVREPFRRVTYIARTQHRLERGRIDFKGHREE